MYRFRVERGRNHILAKRTMVLSRADSLEFVRMLNNPPKPNKELKEAAEAYSKVVEDRGLDFEAEDTYNMQGEALKSRLEEE